MFIYLGAKANLKKYDLPKVKSTSNLLPQTNHVIEDSSSSFGRNRVHKLKTKQKHTS